MNAFVRTVTLSCATLTMASLDGYGQSAVPLSHGAAPVDAEVPASKGTLPTSPAPTEEADLQADLRCQAILSQLPDLTAVRLDEHDIPVAQMDVYCGSGLPKDVTTVLAMLQSFDFGEAGSDGKRREVGHSRTILLPPSGAPSSPTDIVCFDPQVDMAIAFRRLTHPTAISCNASFSLNYNGTLPTGYTWYWYTSSDMVAASAGPQKMANSDPDLFLAYWTGSSYFEAFSSTASNLVDTVYGYQAGCVSQSRRLRIYMYAGGANCVRVHTFSAQ